MAEHEKSERRVRVRKRDVAGAETAARVRMQRDPVIERIVAGWPAAFESTFGRSLGMRVEDDFREVIRARIEDSGLRQASV